MRAGGKIGLGIIMKPLRDWARSLEAQVGSGSFSSGRSEHRTAFLYILGASSHSQSSVLPHAGLPDMCHKELRMGTMTLLSELIGREISLA